MKICVAQIRPVKGDIQSNINNHKKLIGLAVSNKADIIIFPELSLTGYEPELAKQLATGQNDKRFDELQEISDRQTIAIGVGVPTKNEKGTCISMILFQPNEPRQTYSKKYLHADEEAYFVAGKNAVCFSGNKANIALAICYELSVPAHAEDAYKTGAQIYITSVAKTKSGVDKAIERLCEIACMYQMTVLMSNCIGDSAEGECAGNTSIINKEGLLTAQLNETDEGILILDTNTQQVIIQTM